MCPAIPVLVKLSQLAIRACCLANAFTIPSRDEVDDDDGDEEMVTDRAPAQEAIPALADAFSLDSTRSICATVLARAQGHLAGSRSVWQHWRAFETSLLRVRPFFSASRDTTTNLGCSRRILRTSLLVTASCTGPLMNKMTERISLSSSKAFSWTSSHGLTST